MRTSPSGPLGVFCFAVTVGSIVEVYVLDEQLVPELILNYLPLQLKPRLVCRMDPAYQFEIHLCVQSVTTIETIIGLLRLLGRDSLAETQTGERREAPHASGWDCPVVVARPVHKAV